MHVLRGMPRAVLRGERRGGVLIIEEAFQLEKGVDGSNASKQYRDLLDECCQTNNRKCGWARVRRMSCIDSAEKVKEKRARIGVRGPPAKEIGTVREERERGSSGTGR